MLEPSRGDPSLRRDELAGASVGAQPKEMTKIPFEKGNAPLARTMRRADEHFVAD
jgi:hypothetical protein